MLNFTIYTVFIYSYGYIIIIIHFIYGYIIIIIHWCMLLFSVLFYML